MGIVIFDGLCNLCSGTVLFLIKRDRKKRMQFASLQSEGGQALLSRYGVPFNSSATILYIPDDSRILEQSTAVLHILKDLGGCWRFFYVFIFLPRIFRDAIYRFIARNRYRWFGKKEKCMIPSNDIKTRFID